MAAPMPRLAPVTTTHSRSFIMESLIAEFRLSFFDKSLHALLGVARAVGQGGEVRFDAQTLVQRQVHGALHRLASELQGAQSVATELARVGLGRSQAGRLHDAVH